jgi:hypothetical protein
MELDDIKVSLNEEIQNRATVVIGVELLYNVDQWFDESRKVGIISTEKVRPSIIAFSNDLGSWEIISSDKISFRLPNIHHRRSTSTSPSSDSSFRA